MKKLLLFFALIASAAAFGQNGYPPAVRAYGNQFNRLRADSAQHVPHKYGLTTNTNDTTPQAFVYTTASGDSLAWYANGRYHIVPNSFTPGSVVLNNGNATGLAGGLLSGRPTATNCKCFYFSTTDSTLYYDNGAWIPQKGGSGGSSGTDTATIHLYFPRFSDSTIKYVTPTQMNTTVAGKLNTGSYTPGQLAIVNGAGNIAPMSTAGVQYSSSGVATLDNNFVANGKLAQMGAGTIKSNLTGGTANAADNSIASVEAAFALASAGLNGLAPATGTPSGKFLQDNMTWGTPGGGSLPSQTGHATNFLQTDGTNASWNDPRLLDTLYVADDGQSNDFGNSDNVNIDDTASDFRVLVQDTVTGGFKVAHAGQYPFNLLAGTNNSLCASFYFARKYARTYNRYVKILHLGHNGVTISTWHDGTSSQPFLDSLVARINRFLPIRVDVFFWIQGESDNSTAFSVYNKSSDSLKANLRRRCPSFTGTTKILDFGMPQVSLGAPTGFQGQQANKQTRDYNGDLMDAYVPTDSGYVNSANNMLHYRNKGLQYLGEIAAWNTWLSIPGHWYELNNSGLAPGAVTQTGELYVTTGNVAGVGALQYSAIFRDTSSTGTGGIYIPAKDTSNDFTIAMPNPGVTYLHQNYAAIGTKTLKSWEIMRGLVSHMTLGNGIDTFNVPVVINPSSGGSALKIVNTNTAAGPTTQYIGATGSDFWSWTLNNASASNPSMVVGFYNSAYDVAYNSTGTLLMNTGTIPSGGANSTLEVLGSMSEKVDSFVNVDATLSTQIKAQFNTGNTNRTCFLPSVSGKFGRKYFIIKTDAGTGTVTITPQSPQLINGAATFVLTGQYAWANIYTDGNQWIANTSSSGTTPTLQQVVTAGSTMTSNTTIALGGNLWSLTGGNVGIGATGISSAQLKIGAPTSTVSQINFASGTFPTSPNNGDFGYDGTHLYFNNGSVNKDLLASAGTPTFQQVLTAGSTMTGNNTVALGGNLFSYTGGNFGVGATAITSSQLAIGAPTTSVSSINLAAGTAPTSPNQGDLSAVTGHLYYRDGSTTYDLLVGAGGGTTPGGSTTQFQYNNGGAFGGSSSWTFDNTNLGVKLSNGSLGTSSTIAKGLYLVNSTAAAAAAQQYSPILTFEGQGWKTNSTAASQSVQFLVGAQPVQGTANPTGNLMFQSIINGGTATNVFQVGSAGDLTIMGGGAGGNGYIHSQSGFGLILYSASGSLNLGQNVSRPSTGIAFNNGNGSQHAYTWWNASGTQTMEFNDGGGLCIGCVPSATPATWLGIKAGTTSQSQLNLASSSAPTSPNNGDIWNDGTHVNAQLGGATIQLDNAFPLVKAAAFLTSQTSTATTNITSYANPASDGTYQVGGLVNLTANAGGSVLQLQVTFTDETNTSQTLNILTGLSGVGYNAGTPLFIRVKASTTITVRVLGNSTGTTTFNAQGTITQIQ